MSTKCYFLCSGSVGHENVTRLQRREDKLIERINRFYSPRQKPQQTLKVVPIHVYAPPHGRQTQRNGLRPPPKGVALGLEAWLLCHAPLRINIQRSSVFAALGTFGTMSPLRAAALSQSKVPIGIVWVTFLSLSNQNQAGAGLVIATLPTMADEERILVLTDNQPSYS